MRRIVQCAFSTVALLLTTSCGGGGSSDPVSGNVIQANTNESLDQHDPKIAVLESGDIVIAWTSDDQDSDSEIVFARLFSSTLQPLSGEFRVEEGTDGSQELEGLAPLDDGGFIVAWGTPGMFARRYDGNGAPAGQPFRVDGPFGDAFAIDGQGRFVIADRDTCETYHYGNKYCTCLTGRRTQVDGSASGYDVFSGPAHENYYGEIVNQTGSAVAASTTGEFVIVWNEPGWYFGHHGNYDYFIYGQRFDAAAAPLDQISFGSFGAFATQAKASMNDAGSFVVATDFCETQYDYGEYSQACGYAGVAGTRVAADGDRDSFLISRNEAYVDGEYSDRLSSTAINARNFVVVWSRSTEGADETHIVAKLFDDQAHPVGTQFVVDEGPATPVCCAEAVLGHDDSTVVVWESEDADGRGVFARRVPPVGEEATP
jgi:hypothetical protein